MSTKLGHGHIHGQCVISDEHKILYKFKYKIRRKLNFIIKIIKIVILVKKI